MPCIMLCLVMMQGRMHCICIVLIHVKCMCMVPLLMLYIVLCIKKRHGMQKKIR